MSKIQSWAALKPGTTLSPFEYNADTLKPDEVEVEVEYCGLCHSDIAAIKNDRYNPSFPCVPGHEIIGKIIAKGEHVFNRKVGQNVGIGWTSKSCLHCPPCIEGEENFCQSPVRTIIGHYGGFAQRVRAQWLWAFPLPENLDPTSAGPLMCAGLTDFSSFHINNVKPSDHVGIIGVGGLGHLAIKIANAWGCQVTAFTSSKSKIEDAKKFGAHQVVTDIKNEALIKSIDFLLFTSTAQLEWSTLLNMLKLKGKLHIVGYPAKPFTATATELIAGNRSVSGSSTGNPTNMQKMLEFCARHNIKPEVEHFPMSKINQIIGYLEAGKPRYRIVLDADFK